MDKPPLPWPDSHAPPPRENDEPMRHEFSSLTVEWPDSAHAALQALTTPLQIQQFLDATPYSTEPIYRSPLSVLRDQRAHCFDGALFAAAALYRMGEPPLIVDLRAHNDDDHVITIFKRHGHFGAIAKSNTTVLRFREPVYRTLRELVMSYFDFYYNLKGDKALREYSQAVDLRAYDSIAWLSADDQLEQIAERLDRVRHFTLLSEAMIAGLSPVDEKVFQAGLLGSDADGLYQPT